MNLNISEITSQISPGYAPTNCTPPPHNNPSTDTYRQSPPSARLLPGWEYYSKHWSWPLLATLPPSRHVLPGRPWLQRKTTIRRRLPPPIFSRRVHPPSLPRPTSASPFSAWRKVVEVRWESSWWTLSCCSQEWSWSAWWSVVCYYSIYWWGLSAVLAWYW